MNVSEFHAPDDIELRKNVKWKKHKQTTEESKSAFKDTIKNTLGDGGR